MGSSRNNAMMQSSATSSSTGQGAEEYSASVLSQPYAFQHDSSRGSRTALPRSNSMHGDARSDGGWSRRNTTNGSNASARTTGHRSVASKSFEDSDSKMGCGDVIIEEKRRRAHGEGYTIHQYLRGRMLGKGGFAKVYLCTALDTGKNYAVKVVSKSNLVKARARQKVCRFC